MSNQERSCGSCTKCCEGWLEGDAHGHDFSPGKPCYFLIQKKGCTIYSDRPEHPCRSFKCAWLADTSVPDHIKPNVSETIFMISNQDLILVNAGNEAKKSTIEWAQDYSHRNNLKLVI